MAAQVFQDFEKCSCNSYSQVSPDNCSNIVNAVGGQSACKQRFFVSQSIT